MTINVDEFMLDLMTNPNPSHYSQYWSNVKDFCQFRINMYITIPRATTLQVPANAGFHYILGVQFIDYHAVWGMFEPSADMSDENEVVIADEWSAWRDLQAAKLPFADPKIDLQITTQIAGALKLTVDQVLVRDRLVIHHADDSFSKHVGNSQLLHLSTCVIVRDTVCEQHFFQLRLFYAFRSRT